MENVKINITGDVHIHINLGDLEDFFEDDEFAEDFGDEEDEEDDSYDDDEGENEMPDISIFVGGLPEDIDREAVQAVIESACTLLDGLIEKAAATRKGDPHEGV